MSETTFKVGDRVRVNSKKLSQHNGKVGDVVAVDNENLWSVVEFDGEFFTQQFHYSHLEHEQPRLPQVGEVWVTRCGTLSVKLEPVKDPDELSRGYTLCGTCSDGEFRTWSPTGKFDLLCDTWALHDLANRVSEAQSEPQPEPTTELEVSVDVVSLVSIKDEATGISIYHDPERDVSIDSTRQHETAMLTCPSLDEIAALARCLAKLHEILSKEAAK